MVTVVEKKKVSESGEQSKKKAFPEIRKDWDLYLLLVPGLMFLIVFKYMPMCGLVIAFQKFNIFKGISGSEWIGFVNYQKLFASPQFYDVFRNTLIISVYKLIFLFPFPIVIAILLNELRKMTFKRIVQSVIYLPHFISWVIVSGLFINLFSINGGIINSTIVKMGGQPIAFFLDQHVFRSMLVLTAGWKEVGWGTIVYLAAITSIDPQIYEAAKIDGAGKFRQIWNVTIPGLAPTIVLMLILRLGSMLEAGTEQILVMYNPVVYDVADVIGTYVYRMGIGKSDYSFTTAVGFFESVVAFILVISGNYFCRKFLERSIW